MKRAAKVAKVQLLEWSPGIIARELTGKYGAVFGAWRKLNALGHLAIDQGTAFECAKCGARWTVSAVDGGFVLRGDAATECQP